MDEFDGGFILGTVVTIVVFGLILILTPDYKDGQVDALTGNIKYELVVQQDSTRTWEKIEK